MNHASIRTMLADVELGPTLSFNDIHVIPVIGGSPSAIAYISLSRALASGDLVITEVSAEGSVPNLAVENNGDDPVLLLDGEELAGAKQNRTLNTSILVPGRSKLIVPVSCTEARRWQYHSAQFTDSGHFAARDTRLRKNLSVQDSLRSERGHRADQGKVWASIDDLHRELHTSSPTSAMSDAFERSRSRLDEAMRAFTPIDGQRGLVVIRDGLVAGMDVVSRPDVYATVHDKLIASYAIHTARRPQTSGEPADPEELAWRFIAKIADAEPTEHASVGEGTDIRFEEGEVFGAALVVETEVVHLNAFPVEKGPERRRRPASDEDPEYIL